VEQPFIFHVLRETAEQRAEDGGMYYIAAGTAEESFSTTLVRAWTAMAARGDPNVQGELAWPTFGSNGSALLIKGGGGAPPSFDTALDFMDAKCALFDSLFERTPRQACTGCSVFSTAQPASMVEVQ
jgi:hypothetical protein